MKILHCIRSVNPKGGGPISGVIARSFVLKQWGHLIEIVSLDAPNGDFLVNFPLKVYPLGPGLTGYGYSPRLVPWLKRNAVNYDCVIVNGIWQFNSFGTWLALHRSSVPYFVFTHGMLDPWFKRTYPLKHLKKWLYWPWGDYQVLRDAKAVFFTSEAEKNLARQSFWLYQCREKVVAYGTAAPRKESILQSHLFFQKFPHLLHKRLVLFLSRIHIKKGCDLLIQAFARICEHDERLHLVMAGPNQTGWQSQLEELAKSLGIAGRITWTGMLEGDLKWGAFQSAEVFCLPSHQENFGLAVVEALACQLPVLISDQINIWQEIEADQAGFVAPDTLAGTIELLSRWINLPNEQKLQMCQNAQACFISRFEIHQATESFLKTIQSCLLEP
ncbi:glycosyltransferase [Synechococcus sp. PCC 6312]|uniref:glycosyltransferase n=1 Tax=Synechococcus sp. (strain ATCC 27167 / PCC 6312) TaxID=195253 RepID=UPI00029F1683|nr:glycosyltransferase [Synechococcus sp. PCC 6312]AFY59952.1 glycosyltransferase [Synechococcus sp. PCC 6312]